MKQTLLIFGLCFLTQVTNAQIEPGTKYIGGTVGGSVQTTYSDSKTSTFNLKPVAGYFINSNWMIGLNTGYSISNSENYYTTYTGAYNQIPITYSQKITTLKIGPAVRYYHPISAKFSVFGESAAGISFIKDKHTTDIEGYSNPNTYYTGSESNIKTKKLYTGLAPGVVFFPTSKVGIELKTDIINFQTAVGDDKDYSAFRNNSKSNFNTSLSLANTSIGVGLYF